MRYCLLWGPCLYNLRVETPAWSTTNVLGGKDEHIGDKAPRDVADALKNAGKSFTNIVFSEGKHGFFCDQRDTYNPNAARLSWAITIKFLRQNLSLSSGIEKDLENSW